MTEPSPAARWSSPEMRARLRRRHVVERRFRRAGIAAVGVALLALATQLGSILASGSSAFVSRSVCASASAALASGRPRSSAALPTKT